MVILFDVDNVGGDDDIWVKKVEAVRRK